MNLGLIYIYGLIFIMGLVMGSFCNAWAWRLANNEQISKGRSHCPRCNHVLGVLDLVPLFSYIALGGKCRYCKAKISPRYPLAEMILGIGFVSSLYNFGLMNMDLAILWMIVLSLLLTLSLVDMEIFEIPNRLIVGLVIVFMVYGIYKMDWIMIKDGILASIVLAIALFSVILIADKIMKRESMGGGDIKLLIVLGLYFGLSKSLLLIIVSCIIGIIFAMVAKKKDKVFAFGPSIALGAFGVMIFGDEIIKWYLSLFI